MIIGLIDVFIILFLAMGGIIGFKSGAIKELTRFVGFFLVVLISFYLKDKLMVLLYENLPFFDFGGIFKGIDAINILLYQLISFLVIFMMLIFLLKVLIVITGLVEWLVKMTIFLSLPSKLLGMVIGIIEYYVYIFLILYILNMPVFNITFVSESKLGNIILNDTPVLSKMVDSTVKVYSDVWEIIKNKENRSNSEINELVLESLLNHKLITLDSAEKLLQSNKIIVHDTNLLDRYKKQQNQN